MKTMKFVLWILFILFLTGNVFSLNKVGPLLQIELSKHDLKVHSHIKSAAVESLQKVSIPIIFCSKSNKFGDPIMNLSDCYLYFKKASLDNIFQLIEDPDVLFIEKQKTYRPLLFNAIPVTGGNLTNITVVFNGTNYTIPYNIFYVNNKIINGSKVRVAIIDSGINPENPWFNNAKIVYKAGVKALYDESGNFAGCLYNETNYIDEDGHGTHVAGIVHSVAPGAELVILKLLNWTGSDVYCAINKAIELNSSIISMSLGTLFWIFSDYPLNKSLTPYGLYIGDFLTWYVNKKTVDNNVTFVIAAGNEAIFPWHYNDTVSKNKTVTIKIINWLDSTWFAIRWYNPSSHINITVYNETSPLLILYWDSSENSYKLKNFTSFNAEQLRIFSDFSNWTNESYISLILKEIESPIVYVNITADNETEFDFYEYTVILCHYLGICNHITPFTPYSTLCSPGVAKYAITVGSFISSNYGLWYHPTYYPNDTFGHISSFSSRGPLRYNYSLIKPEVVAPGDIIVSANYDLSSGIYLNASGTSMATPFVAGVIALIKQIVPTATPFEIKDYLRYITEPEAYNLSQYDIYTKGFGLINITKAIMYLPKLYILDDTFNNSPIILKNRSAGISIYAKNVGKMRAKIKLNNTIITIPPNKTSLINIPFNEKWIGVYNVTINLTGEFLNSPLIKNITILALPNLTYNLSIEELAPNIINVTIEFNNTGYYTHCKLKLSNTTYEFNVTESGNITFSAESDGVTYINYTIECYPETIHIPFIYTNMLKEYSIFDEITPIIIYSGNLTDYNLTFGNTSKKSFYGIELGEGNKTIKLIYIFNNRTIEKFYNTTIIKPTGEIKFLFKNLTNNTFTENSTLIIKFYMNNTPQNLTFIIDINNKTVVNKTLFTNETEFELDPTYFTNGTNTVNVSVLFLGRVVYNNFIEFFANLPVGFIVFDAKEYNGIYYTNRNNVTLVFFTPVNGTIDNKTVTNLKEFYVNCTKEGIVNITLNVTAYGIWINKTLTFVCDFTPPTIKIYYNNLTKEDKIRIIVDWVDNYSPFILYNNLSLTKNASLSLNLTPGWNFLVLEFQDLAGNSNSTNISVYYDNLKPNISIQCCNFTNKTPIKVYINLTDDFLLKNIIVLLNNESLYNTTLYSNFTNITLNLTNLTYGENNLTIILYDLAGWRTEKTHLIIFDDKSPQIIIKEPTENAIYYSKFPLYVDIDEDYLEVVLISIKETKHNNTYNNIVIRDYLACPENQTINVFISVRDKAGNVNSTTIRVRCGIINDIAEDTNIIHSVKLVNGSVKISYPDEQETHRVEGNRKIYNKIVKINISVGNNTSGIAVLKYRIPQDYSLSFVYKILENGTKVPVKHTTLGGYVYIELNLTVDPVLVIEFQKEETIPTSTEDTYSGGSGEESYSGGGGTTVTSHKRSTDSVKNEENNISSYFNYTVNISNNTWTIEFETFNISEKTIKVEIPYIKTIVIKPNQTNTTGILEIKTVNITPLPNFKVKKAYLVRIVNGSAYIELSEPALCGYNIFTKCTSVNVSKMTYIVFGSLIKLYKPIQQQNVTVQPVKTSNKTLENVTSNETKEKQTIAGIETSEDIQRKYTYLLAIGVFVLIILIVLILLVVRRATSP